MNISKKWSTAAAAALTVALVAGGAASANAEPLNPQSNGSQGSFYLWDGGTGEFADGDLARVYTRGESIIGAASKTDVLAEINPLATRPVTGANSFSQVYRFVSDRSPAAVAGGTSTWKAYSSDAAAGPKGGTLTPDMSLDGLINGIDTVIAAGGDYWYGVAYTTNAGVTTVGAVYREITIEKGTGNYTVGPVEEKPGTKIVQPLDSAAKATTLATTVIDSKVIALNAGAAYADQKLNVAAFAAGGARIELKDQLLFDGSGNATVDVAGKGLTLKVDHELFVYEMDGINEVLRGWDTFMLEETPGNGDTALTVNVTTSNRFELKAPVGPSVNLGDVKRNKTTSAVALGQFSVVDDRDVLLGWNLNVTASDFTGPNGATIDKAALGYAPVVAGGIQGGVTLGAAKVAGAGSFGKLVDGAVNTSTTEEGAVFDTNLTFKAPVAAVKGAYNSTLTLDLVSK